MRVGDAVERRTRRRSAPGPCTFSRALDAVDGRAEHALGDAHRASSLERARRSRCARAAPCSALSRSGCGLLELGVGGARERLVASPARRAAPPPRASRARACARRRRARSARRATRAVRELERRRDRDERERERRAVAHLAVARARGDRAGGGSSTAMISSPGSSTVSRSGSSPGRRCSSGSGIARSPAGPCTWTTRVERGQRDRHVGRVRRDAALGVPEDREVAVLALDAPGSRSPGSRLLHGLRHVLEVRAARALEQVAARSWRRLRSWPEAPESSACASAG